MRKDVESRRSLGHAATLPPCRRSPDDTRRRPRWRTFAANARSGRVPDNHLRDRPVRTNVPVNVRFPADIVSRFGIPLTAKKAYDLSAITRGSCLGDVKRTPSLK